MTFSQVLVLLQAELASSFWHNARRRLAQTLGSAILLIRLMAQT
jgi:hypothetical protein